RPFHECSRHVSCVRLPLREAASERPRPREASGHSGCFSTAARESERNRLGAIRAAFEGAAFTRSVSVFDCRYQCEREMQLTLYRNPDCGRSDRVEGDDLNEVAAAGLFMVTGVLDFTKKRGFQFEFAPSVGIEFELFNETFRYLVPEAIAENVYEQLH